jgi:hypothetical protein
LCSPTRQEEAGVGNFAFSKITIRTTMIQLGIQMMVAMSSSSISKKTPQNYVIASVQQYRIPILGTLMLMKQDWHLVVSSSSVLKSIQQRQLHEIVDKPAAA